jgi:hypothetical protein
VTDEDVTKKKFKKKRGKKRKEKISGVLDITCIGTGMFHSGEEQQRTVDPLNELQHSYGSTGTLHDATNSPSTYELGHITASDFDSIGFELDCNAGRRDDSWGVSSSVHGCVGEQQCFTTFAPEDKWPI